MHSDYVFDFNRIFFGDLPAAFLAEIAFRTTVVYGFALFIVRMLGKRGMGQLAPFDFVIIIALGSAVGDPMFYRSIPLLHSMVAIAGVVLLTRAVVVLSNRSERVQRFIASAPTRLVKDGALDMEGLREEKLAQEEIFEGLRSKGVQQLGQVERAYLEPSGVISAFLYSRDGAKPGLPMLPAGSSRAVFSRPDALPAGGNYACLKCGNTIYLRGGDTVPECPVCAHDRFTRAVYTLQDQIAPAM